MQGNSVEYPDQFLTIGKVCDTVGYCPSMVYRLIKEGSFPAPIKPGGVNSRASRWLLSSVVEWMNDRIAESPVRNDSAE